MDSTLLAGIIGLVGALIGGAIGGYGSYMGGTKGAKDNFQMQARLNKEHAIKRLSTQLFFTSELIKGLINFEERTFIPIETLNYIVYDKGWVEQICYADHLSSDQFSAILNWFQILESLEKINKDGRRMTCADLNKIIGSQVETIHKIAELL